MAKPKDFPALFWNPETGDPKVFSAATEVPEGWLDHHPHGDNYPAAADPVEEIQAPVPLSRTQVVAELNKRGVAFQRNGATAALYEKLVAAVELEA